MRPIKFRIYNTKTKEWLHGPHESPFLDGINLFGETIMMGGMLRRVSIEDLNEIVALQYTGLDDKNGKPIFEGDIIRKTWKVNNPYGYDSEEWDEREEIFEVKYQAPSFNIEAEYGDGGQYCVEDFAREIVGNIYDNPELLK
jgi:uncharacterized phage protein (TIGR01671 family)